MSTQQKQQPTQPASLEPVPLVPIESIIPNPRQPRRAFREDDPKLQELSASIKEHGLIQPIVVTRLDSPKPSQDVRNSADSWLAEDPQPYTSAGETASAVVQYQIIAGERRW